MKDAWTLYCEIFHELFPNDGKPVLSVATLDEFAARLRTQRPEADTYSPTWEEVDELCRGRSNIDLAEMVLKLRHGMKV